MKKNQWFALLLALCLWWTATATAEEILAAPVEETVADAQADLWTKDIAEDAAKAEAEAAAMDAGDVPIDEAHFPDANFRAYVLDHCDKDKNGILSNAEAGAVTFLWVNNENIASLEGVEYFFALNDLVCQGNPLTSLDVSKCARLTKLDCMSSQLTSLNISGCVDL